LQQLPEHENNHDREMLGVIVIVVVIVIVIAALPRRHLGASLITAD